MGDPQPMAFPQGVGRVIPGFDYGLDGMKIGGKRRLFIPWQLAYGTRAMPDRPDHPGIPAKSDLIFDVELVDMTDMPAPMARPGMPGMHPGPGGMPPHPGASTQPNAAPSASGAPATQAAPAQPTKAAAPATAPATTTQPSAPAQSQPQTQPQQK
jgi:peptidylprolyl isomerase